MTDRKLHFDGRITGCQDAGVMCGFDCCRQDALGEAARPESSLLLYPGEFEAVAIDRRAHIVVTLGDFFGGKLGYCDPSVLDQRNCDESVNFKPLDCQSYPFAPAFRDGELVLLIDTQRCPLDPSSLRQYYDVIIAKWRDVLIKNPAVGRWMEKLSLAGYTEFNC